MPHEVLDSTEPVYLLVGSVLSSSPDASVCEVLTGDGKVVMWPEFARPLLEGIAKAPTDSELRVLLDELRAPHTVIDELVQGGHVVRIAPGTPRDVLNQLSGYWVRPLSVPFAASDHQVMFGRQDSDQDPAVSVSRAFADAMLFQRRGMSLEDAVSAAESEADDDRLCHDCLWHLGEMLGRGLARLEPVISQPRLRVVS